jgi:hypothetical protein
MEANGKLFWILINFYKMEKKNLVTLLKESLVPLGYKHKGNNWVNNHGTIIKLVNLQQSNYGKQFYINYGFIIKDLPLDITHTHVEERLWRETEDSNASVSQLLDLENDMSEEYRTSELKRTIFKNLIPILESINTEGELLAYLKQRPNLNDIPIYVKQYFKLPIQ